ncbi:Thiolase, N-terminal domain-containing protein [Chytridium lagenaria]|nr:Thiolase, N-terminal domain-containing protein [Chytridium lagenaria]
MDAQRRINALSNHLEASAPVIVSENQASAARAPKSPDDVVIISAIRSPLTKGGKGAFRETHPEYIMGETFKALIAKSGVDPASVQDIQIGNVLMPGAGVTTARMAALYGGFPDTTAVCAVNRQCSSAGQIDMGIGAGVESMTLYYGPGAMPTDLSPEVMAFGPAAEVMTPMGTTSENVAAEFGVTRAEQDAFALRSHNLAFKAQKEGLFNEEIAPIKLADGTVVSIDDGIRPSSAEALAKLRPAFKKDGASTAGNSSQVTDGAAAAMLRSTVLSPLRRFLGFSVVGCPPRIMGIGPAVAIPAVLKQVGLQIADIDVWEINEAFASQAVYCVKKLGIDVEKVNPKGGAIAFGHPMGATGARQVATLLPELKRTKKRYGVISMCVGIGMGAAAVIENEIL